MKIKKKDWEDYICIKFIIRNFTIKLFYFDEYISYDWSYLLDNERFSFDHILTNRKNEEQDTLTISKIRDELIISNKKCEFLFTFPFEEVREEISELCQWLRKKHY